MKIIFLIISVISLCFSFDKKLDKPSSYHEREFISVGMQGILGENYSFVCIDDERWLEQRLEDKIELSKIYMFNEELQKDMPVPCYF